MQFALTARYFFYCSKFTLESEFGMVGLAGSVNWVYCLYILLCFAVAMNCWFAWHLNTNVFRLGGLLEVRAYYQSVDTDSSASFCGG